MTTETTTETPTPVSTPAASTTTFIVMEAAACMPNSCWGRYRRIAVVEIDPAKLPEGRTTPTMISDRSRGVVRVVATWERCHDGITERCAAGRARGSARAMVAELNG